MTQSSNHPHHASSHEGGHGHHVKHTPEEWAKKLDAKERDTWQQPTVLIEHLNIQNGHTVAEIGAGTGYFLKYLSKAVGPNGQVLAQDVEADLVAYMTKRAEAEKLTNVKANVCGFTDPALPNAGVDRILMVNTWHHLSNRVAYAQTLKSALRAGGEIYIVDFKKDSTVGPPRESKLTEKQVIDDFVNAGYQTSKIDTDLPEQYVIRAVLAP